MEVDVILPLPARSLKAAVVQGLQLAPFESGKQPRKSRMWGDWKTAFRGQMLVLQSDLERYDAS